MSTEPASLGRRRAREHASRPKQHTDQEMRLIMSTKLPSARNGHLQDIRYFAGGVREYSEFVVPEVFEAFLEHLRASKVPPMETLPTSFALTPDRSFRDLIVERAFQSLIGLANSAPFSDLIGRRTELGELLVACWPDVLSWMWYFFIACFERNLGDRSFKLNMHRILCLMFAVGCHRDSCTISIGEIPGSVRLATLICMLDPEGAYLNQEDTCLGTFTMAYFLQVKIKVSFLDEVLEVVGGDAKIFIDTMITRLERVLNTPEIIDKSATIYATLFIVLYHTPKHPLWIALRERNPTVILTNALRRLLETLSQSASSPGRFGSDTPMRLRHVITTILSHISVVTREDSARVKQAMQALQAGIMGVLIDYAPIAFTFQPIDRDAMVGVLKQLTWLTTQLPIARQASADLERLESVCSLQARFNSSTVDVRTAWVTFYDAILARRTILAQMQALNSTPMSCDNCFRFDERANFKKCAGCSMVHYCSRECQRRAWKERGHKAECQILKDKPAKGKRRATNQEKYFLARVAVNDAQHKKEQLKQMASIGMKKISVLVDYREFPPRCLVNYSKDEMDSYHRETKEIMEEVGTMLERCESLLRQSGGSMEDTILTPYREITNPNRVQAYETSATLAAVLAGDESAEPLRIHLVDVDSETGAESIDVPPVHVIVYLPPIGGTRHPRNERFVIDDYWEFLHIKFEDSSDELPEALEEDEENKYVLAPGSYSPDVQELTRLALLKESRRAYAEKGIAATLEKYQGIFSTFTRELGEERTKAVKMKATLLKFMSENNML